ncbi:MAG: ATP-binding cassette domain-containing protein [Lachnospiraceae bacterium]|nr:ATP-binding cassette domain-containing protein [Lachnospiraceae bacterium]
MIKVEGLDKYFNRRKKNEIHVIHNTTLTFGNSGLVCILGESGSGKTTLLNVMGGLDSFSGGSITVDEERLDRYVPKKMDKLRNRKYGYIFQNYYLLSEYSVEYNIKVALKCFDMSEEELDDRVNYVLNAVEMRRYKNKPVSELSGGQRQRVAIARALAKTPDVIFADEPTGNLDENNTLRVMSILKKISKDCLVILVTHEERIARFFADRIIKVQDGVVTEDVENVKSVSYTNEADADIYLGEFKKKEITTDGGVINVYHDGAVEPFMLNMVFSNGKLYIESRSEVKVLYITDESETQLVDGTKPEMKQEDLEEFSFELKKVPAGGNNKLSLSELFTMARYNLKNMGKKQIFMHVIFVLASIMMLLTASDLYRVAFAKPWEMVSNDSHYVTVQCMHPGIAEEAMARFDGQSKLRGEKYSNIKMGLKITSNNYSQLKELDRTLTGFSYVDVKYLDESLMLYGRMPENENEIVIEKSVLDKVLNGNTILSTAFDTAKDFLGEVVYCSAQNVNFTICGISDGNEMSAYVAPKWIGLASLNDNDYYNRKNFQVYTESPEEVATYFNNLNEEFEEYYDGFNVYRDPVIQASYPYGKDKEAYHERVKNDISLRLMITGIVVLLSVIVLVFTMKANALRRTEELVVYRLIGITPGNIMLSYVFETIIITIKTQLVPIIIATGVCKYLSGVIRFDLLSLCPWGYLLLLIAGTFAINSLVAVLSVRGIIRRPPAQLAAKN